MKKTVTKKSRLRLLALVGALLMMLTLLSSCGERSSAQLQLEIYKNYESEFDFTGVDKPVKDEEKIAFVQKTLQEDTALQQKIWKDQEEKKGINFESIWDIIQVPFGWLLDLFNRISFSNYLLAMLLFTIAMKVVLLPSGIKQQKNMIKQASFAPRQRAIQKKYAGRTDRETQQKMQQELMQAQQDAGISPFSGCLGLLWQFPVLICLYTVIRYPLRFLSHLTSIQGEVLQIRAMANGYTGTDQMQLMAYINNPENFGKFGDLLSDKVRLANFKVFGLDFSATPSFTPASTELWLLLVIPVLVFFAYFFSMKLTRKLSYQPPAMDGQPDVQKSMQMMDWAMPLFSVYICFNVPALLGVYWIYQSALGVLQSYLLKKVLPFPEFTEEDFKAAERQYNGKKAKKTSADSIAEPDPNRPKPRSLHHIDDDDEDELPESLRNAPVSTRYGDEDDVDEAPTPALPKAPLKDSGAKKQKKGKKADEEEEEE